MKRPIVCTQCGAPLHRGKCDYCGAEYDTDDFIGIKYEVVNAKTETLQVKEIVPMEIMRYMSPEDAYDHVKKDMARKLADGIAQYMDIKTYLDPQTLSQQFRGKIKIVLPGDF